MIFPVNKSKLNSLFQVFFISISNPILLLGVSLHPSIKTCKSYVIFFTDLRFLGEKSGTLLFKNFASIAKEASHFILSIDSLIFIIKLFTKSSDMEHNKWEFMPLFTVS